MHRSGEREWKFAAEASGAGSDAAVRGPGHPPRESSGRGGGDVRSPRNPRSGRWHGFLGRGQLALRLAHPLQDPASAAL